MWHKACRTFHPWCPCTKTRCLSLCLMPAATDPTDHGTVIAAEPPHFGFLWLPRFATMEHSWANVGLVHLATYLGCEVSGGKDREEFPELSPGHTASGSNDTVTAPTRAQGIIQVAESGFHINHGAVDIQFSHGSAIDGPDSPLHLG